MGLDFIRWIQSAHSPLLDRLMLWISNLGHEDFYLLVGPIIFWCFGAAVGMRLVVILLSSFYLNDLLKDLVAWPRPAVAYPDQVRLPEGAAETAYDEGGEWSQGFPSGHAQNAVVFWGFIADWLRRVWLFVCSVIVVLLIAFSRLYLGLHWPTDVLGGWGIGLAILALFLVVVRRPAMLAPSRRDQLLLGGAAAGLLLFLMDQNVDRAKILGFWSGALVAYLLQQRYVPFRVHAPLWQQAAKIFIGLAGAFALRTALKSGLPTEAWAHWLRYALVALWVAAAAPALFRLLFGAPDESVPARTEVQAQRSA